MVRLVIFCVLYLVLGFYSYQAIKTAVRQPWVHYLYVAIVIFVLVYFLAQFFWSDRDQQVLSVSKSYAFGMLLTVMVFMFISVLFLFSEDIFRVLNAIYQKLSGSNKEFTLPQRRRALSVMALAIAAVPFGALLYGMVRGKYDYRVIRHDLEFEDLPDAFDGYTITHISDIHCGSFDNHEEVAKGVKMVNDQNSDVLLFTGDLVNNKADELLQWKDLFATLKAKDGVFSVLGNHDYGDYIEWKNEELKAQNLTDLKRIQSEMGYDLLLNEHRYLEKDGQRIALVGVENWGKGGFKKAGDLKVAEKGIDPKDFKILMSHDPSHWDAQVVKDSTHYNLTLSGHTHGMQFGIEIPGWVKWSPVKWRYKQWAGIYRENEKVINVNRGFGYIGYPGRVGIWPEITVITLKKKS